MQNETPQYLTPAQLSARFGGAVTVGTLANWRSHSTKEKPVGPAYQKFGSRVRYPLAQVLEWEAANLHGANDNQQKQAAA